MTTHTINKIKLSLLILGAMLISISSIAQSHITMSMKNIKANLNSIEYDLYIVNDGSTNLKLGACSYGVNFDKVILNGGEIFSSIMPNSGEQALQGLTNFSTTLSIAVKPLQARITNTLCRKETAPSLISNIPYKVGRFKLTNTQAWTQNSNPNFSLHEILTIGLTTTQVIVYVGDEQNPTVMSPKYKTVSTEVETSPILNPSADTQSNAQNGSGLMQKKVVIKTYPNPVLGILNIDFNAIQNTRLFINIMDMPGRMVKQIQLNVNEGMNKLNLDLSELNKGIYTITIVDDKLINYSQTFSKH